MGKKKKIDGTIVGDAKPSPEGTWTQGGGIEQPCKYKLYGDIKNKKTVRNILKQGIK